MTFSAQKSDLVRGQREVWGDAIQLCATCDEEAARGSCYCDACEAREFGDENKTPAT